MERMVSGEDREPSMAPPAGTPRTISLSELDDILERAHVEGWRELALLGPGASRPTTVPVARTFRVREPCGRQLPKVAGLSQLTSLDLGGNLIGDDGARALAALTQLNSLGLWRNEISNDGARALAALTQLASLGLSNNRIADDGARALVGLSQLTSLDLGSNQIGDDGARALADLTQLTSLGLWVNQIGPDGARALAGLTQLTYLSLWRNPIGDDGARALADLAQLTSLHLDESQIRADGARALASLTRLTSLRVGGNQIGADGACALAGLTQLTSLDLGGNQIGADGARALAGLTQLTSLHLGNNQIGDDGACALAGLTLLTSLYLGHNQIGDDGGRALAGLRQLTSLALAVNKISDDGARTIAGLTQLTSLNLWGNQIGDDGARALADLTQLNYLDLAGNQIGDNGARALLDALSEPSRSARLETLDLNGNPIASSLVTTEVLSSRKAQAILAAYRRYRDDERRARLRPLNEAKLIVLGNEAVGKTSLIRYLVHGTPRNLDEAKTPGAEIHEQIEVHAWSDHRSPVRLNVWDFGGQEIMRGTHRFFLTARSVYLLVLEDRREDDRSIYDWLETIAQCGGDSPVIVVINKTDGEVPQRVIDETALRRSHPAIVDFARTSCNANDRAAASICSLRTLIATTLTESPRLTHVRDPIPLSWLRVKNAITAEAREQFVLPVRDFEELCRGSAGISEAERITDPDEQRAALLLLHDLGIVVAHGARGDANAAWREVSILDPNWLTKAIYALLTSHVVRDQRGELRRDQLGRLLDPKRYPRRWHELILSMMQDPALGLCLPIARGNSGSCLLPEALPSAEPDYGIWPADSLRFRFQYKRIPCGLVPRLIVEAQRSLTDKPTYWRNGVVLGAEGCHILVRGEPGADRVEIYIAGTTNRRGALSVVRGYFDAVHRHFANLWVEACVPLPDQPDESVPYDHLVQLERDDGLDYQWRPPRAQRKYSVRELLEGVRDEPALRRARRGRQAVDDRDLDEPPGCPAPMVVPGRSQYHGKIDFGIVTIRPDENDAVLRRLEKHDVAVQKRRHRIRRLELPHGGAYMIAVLRSLEQGNTDSLLATRDLLDDLSPRFVLVVGIAGGAPSSEFALGDVVVSSRIVDTSVEAVKHDGSREYAHGGGPLDPEAAGLAADIPAMISDGELDGWNTDDAIGKARPPVDLSPDKFYGSEASKAKLRDVLERRFGGVRRPPLAITGAISSSDRLIKDTAILGRWQELARQVIAVEMESAGVYKATHGRVPFLAIRGISDVVGYERHPDWTAYACETAAAFTRAFLLARPIAPVDAR
jgi:internalin A